VENHNLFVEKEEVLL